MKTTKLENKYRELSMKIIKYLSDNVEIICIGIITAFIAYLVYPPVIQLIFPEVTPYLWSSPLTLQQTVFIMGGIVFPGVALALAKHVSKWRTSDAALIPTWLIAAVVFMVVVLAVSIVAYLGFTFTRVTLLRFGLPGIVALIGGLTVGWFITRFLSR